MCVLRGPDHHESLNHFTSSTASWQNVKLTVKTSFKAGAESREALPSSDLHLPSAQRTVNLLHSMFYDLPPTFLINGLNRAAQLQNNAQCWLRRAAVCGYSLYL